MNVCATCGEEVRRRRSNARYCSSQCKKDAHREDLIRIAGSNLSNGSTGAIGELQACVDLLLRGFHVFRSVSPACPSDLVALRHGRLYLIEVRAGSVNALTRRWYFHKGKHVGYADAFEAIDETLGCTKAYTRAR